MNFILDTHVLLWWLEDSKLLSLKARKAIASTDNLVIVSVASIWEISIKKNLGKLIVPSDLREAVHVSGFEVLPISFSHAMLAGDLPNHHNDPFDRMLIAQAKIEKLTIITHDKWFNHYETELFLV